MATVYQFLLPIKKWLIYIAILAISLIITFTIRFFIERVRKIRGKPEITLLHDTVEIFDGSEAGRVENLSGYFQDGKMKSLFKTNIALSNMASEPICARDLISSDPLRINIEGNERILALRATASQSKQISLKADPARGDSINIIFNSIDPDTCILSSILHSQRGKICLLGTINNKPARFADLGNFTMEKEIKEIFFLGVGMIVFTKLLII